MNWTRAEPLEAAILVLFFVGLWVVLLLGLFPYFRKDRRDAAHTSQNARMVPPTEAHRPAPVESLRAVAGSVSTPAPGSRGVSRGDMELGVSDSPGQGAEIAYRTAIGCQNDPGAAVGDHEGAA